MRPLDLQAWIRKDGIFRLEHLQLGKNLASRVSNFISRNKKRIGKNVKKMGLQRFASDFGIEVLKGIILILD